MRFKVGSLKPLASIASYISLILTMYSLAFILPAKIHNL